MSLQAREFHCQILRDAGMAHLFVFHVTLGWPLIRCVNHQQDGAEVLCAVPVAQDVR